MKIAVRRRCGGVALDGVPTPGPSHSLVAAGGRHRHDEEGPDVRHLRKQSARGAHSGLRRGACDAKPGTSDRKGYRSIDFAYENIGILEAAQKPFVNHKLFQQKIMLETGYVSQRVFAY